MRAARPRDEGQAMTEMLLMTVFLMLLVFGIVQLAMLLTTKLFVNYAAFAAARTFMTEVSNALGSTPGTQIAAEEATRFLNWWGTDTIANRKELQLPVLWDKWTRSSPTNPGKARSGLTVTYRVPFGLPLQVVPPGGVAITAFAPTQGPPAPVRECGDNANAKTEAHCSSGR
jgi:Flp pilus assembly protein TadG